MSWTVKVGEDVAEFLEALTPEESSDVFACIQLLREFGPNLRRPHADTLRNSSHSNMRELRIPHKRKQFRILYAFDTEQNAILLVGGDKVPMGEARWYRKFIALADKRLSEHLQDLEEKRKEKELALRASEKAKVRVKGKQR